jgi:hypothetical protein
MGFRKLKDFNPEMLFPLNEGKKEKRKFREKYLFK